MLAAGFSRRFGSNKLKASTHDGRTLIEHTLDGIAASLDEIIIVSRPGAAADLSGGQWPVLVFDGAEAGMGATLGWGISRLPPWDACLVCLADMPYVQPETYRLLAEKLTSAGIVIPCHNGRRGNPVGFGSRFFAELSELRDERGGKQIIRQHERKVLEVPVRDPAVLMDIDTPEDLSRFPVE